MNTWAITFTAQYTEITEWEYTLELIANIHLLSYRLLGLASRNCEFWGHTPTKSSSRMLSHLFIPILLVTILCLLATTDGQSPYIEVNFMSYHTNHITMFVKVCALCSISQALYPSSSQLVMEDTSDQNQFQIAWMVALSMEVASTIRTQWVFLSSLLK